MAEWTREGHSPPTSSSVDGSVVLLEQRVQHVLGAEVVMVVVPALLLRRRSTRRAAGLNRENNGGPLGGSKWSGRQDLNL